MSGANFYKQTEALLSHYKQLKMFVEIKQIELEEIDYYAVPPITLEYTGGGGGEGSSTENAAVRIADKKERIESQIRKTNRKLERIEMALSTLNDTALDIITDRYINKKQWWQIAYNSHCNERWAKELRKRAVWEIAVALFGEAALEQKQQQSTNTAHFAQKDVL